MKLSVSDSKFCCTLTNPGSVKLALMAWWRCGGYCLFLSWNWHCFWVHFERDFHESVTIIPVVMFIFVGVGWVLDKCSPLLCQLSVFCFVTVKQCASGNCDYENCSFCVFSSGLGDIYRAAVMLSLVAYSVFNFLSLIIWAWWHL